MSEGSKYETTQLCVPHTVQAGKKSVPSQSQAPWYEKLLKTPEGNSKYGKKERMSEKSAALIAHCKRMLTLMQLQLKY